MHKYMITACDKREEENYKDPRETIKESRSRKASLWK